MEGHEPLLPLYAGVGVEAVRRFGWGVEAGRVPSSWEPLEWMAWLRWPREAVEAFSRLYKRVAEGCERVSLVYLDAGSRSSPEARRSVFAVKLAVLRREFGGGVVEERVLHPLLRSEGGAGLPLLVGRGGDRARQAVTYIVELGAVYSLLREGCVLVFKHGPLVQQLQQYLRPSYDLEADVLRSALIYSGVERDEADAVVDAARVEEGRVNAGVAILELLSRITRLAAGSESVAVAGVTEDVTSSRVLASRLLAEAVKTALDAHKDGVLEVDEPGTSIASKIASLVKLGSALLDRLCGDSGCLSRCLGLGGIDEQELQAITVGLVEALHRRLFYEGPAPLRSASIAAIEAAVYTEIGRLLDASDASVILAGHCLAGPIAVTRAWRRDALIELLNWTMSDVKRDVKKDLVTSFSNLYTYVLPGNPPTCARIEELLETRLAAGLDPWILIRLQRVYPPIRVDTVAPSKEEDKVLEKLKGLASLVYMASSISLHGYPAGILVADARSRVALSEASILEELARRLAERLQPYAAILRHWRLRRATVVD